MFVRAYTIDTGAKLLPELPPDIAEEIEDRVRRIPRYFRRQHRRAEYEAAANKLEIQKLRDASPYMQRLKERRHG